jgi:hypothetical protein
MLFGHNAGSSFADEVAVERAEPRHNPDQPNQQGEDNVPCDQERNSSLSMSISSPSCQTPSGPRSYLRMIPTLRKPTFS